MSPVLVIILVIGIVALIAESNRIINAVNGAAATLHTRLHKSETRVRNEIAAIREQLKERL